VQSGQFGACLMASPAIVAECVQAIRAVVAVPVTIKCRIGIDDRDDVEFLHEFVRTTHSAGCDTFIVHARKAILSGLSPKENRSVPPLCHDRVYGLKSAFPGINVVINGGITSVDDCRVHLERVDGVMIGRAAYHSPWLLTDVERKLFGGSFAADRQDVVAQMSAYAQREVRDGTPIRHIARHMLGLYAGQPGARAWRRTISELAYGSGATADVFTLALRKMECVA
jgi:tRNA-dihydrouridine synthase A